MRYIIIFRGIGIIFGCAVCTTTSRPGDRKNLPSEALKEKACL